VIGACSYLAYKPVVAEDQKIADYAAKIDSSIGEVEVALRVKTVCL
jgi:hypothetical protein